MSYIRAITSIAGKTFASNRLLFESRPQMATMGSLRLINIFQKLTLEKVPTAPKRPQNGYTIFFSEISPKVKAQNPSLKVTQLAKLISEEWNRLDDHQKQEYLLKGKSNLTDYKLEKQNWTNSLTEQQVENIKTQIQIRKKSIARRRLKAELKKLEFPIRPQSGYSLFVKDSILNRKDDKTPVQQMFKRVSVEWKALTDEQKAPFLVKAKVDRIRYENEMKDWKNKISKPEFEDNLKKLIDLKSKGISHSKKSIKKKAKKVLKKVSKKVTKKVTKTSANKETENDVKKAVKKDMISDKSV